MLHFSPSRAQCPRFPRYELRDHLTRREAVPRPGGRDALLVDRLKHRRGQDVQPDGAPVRRRREDGAVAEERHGDRARRRPRARARRSGSASTAAHRLQAPHRLPRLADARSRSRRSARRSSTREGRGAAPKADGRRPERTAGAEGHAEGLRGDDRRADPRRGAGLEPADARGRARVRAGARASARARSPRSSHALAAKEEH